MARTPEHRFSNILVIAACALLRGGEGFNHMEDFGEAKEDWFKTFLDCFVRWTQSLRAAVSEKIAALDGKALRRALDAGQGARERADPRAGPSQRQGRRDHGRA